nr:nucleoside hydrolase [Streptosporangium sp. 'caverna']
MALAVILGTPSIDLLGVTTVYGDTLLRARLVRRFSSLADRDTPTYAGIGSPRSGREVWWAGIEGSLHHDLERESVSDEPAVEFLTRAVAENPGQIDIVAIGPLTNIAAAIRANDHFAADVRHLWVMGGIFDGGTGIDGTGIEHNFRSDDESAAIVFTSGIPTTVTGLDVTEQLEFEAEQLTRISAGGELGAALDADIRQWWTHWRRERNVPHDPVAVLTLLHPELFEFSEPGRVMISVGGTEAGRSVFLPDPAGSTRITTALDKNHIANRIVDAIVHASAPPSLFRETELT